MRDPGNEVALYIQNSYIEELTDLGRMQNIGHSEIQRGTGASFEL